MRVFVTGASGFIGSAVVAELLGAGHRVLGLARSDASAQAVLASGAEPHRGALDDLERLRAGASACDAVVHLAYDHDWSTSREVAAAADARAIAAMGDALAGTGRPIAIASGLLGVAQGRLLTEADPASATAGRGASEAVTLELAARGVRGIVVRLPPTVHGAGDRGFVPMLIDLARRLGVSGYVGDGANRWPAVHRSDAARLFRLAIERAPSTRLHAAAEPGVPLRAVADVIARRLGVPAASKTAEQAATDSGFMGRVLALDAPASSEATRALLDWHPTGPELLVDLDSAAYFPGA